MAMSSTSILAVLAVVVLVQMEALVSRSTSIRHTKCAPAQLKHFVRPLQHLGPLITISTEVAPTDAVAAVLTGLLSGVPSVAKSRLLGEIAHFDGKSSPRALGITIVILEEQSDRDL